MTFRFDWKFWVVLLITLAGVIVPVWLWRVDLAARSLHFRQISQSSLQPPDTAKALQLTIALAGVELKAPYLTVFELVNDGAKPISTSDFESPIEMVVTNKAGIIRATVTETSPPDLAPSVLVEDGKMKIKPMLLNPGDSMTVAILTTGEEPGFQPHARVAGVQSVPVTYSGKKSQSLFRTTIYLLAALLCAAASNISMVGWPSKGVDLRPRAAFLTFFVTTQAGALIIITTLDRLGVNGYWSAIGAYLACAFVASFPSSWLNRPRLNTN